jgi:hypothetical protein
VLKYETLKSKIQSFVVKPSDLIFGRGLKKDSKFSAPIVYIRTSLGQSQSTWLHVALRGRTSFTDGVRYILCANSHKLNIN